jgi:hypothetical protein
MLKELLSKVANKENLTYDEAKNAIAEIMGGECSLVLISAFLTALSMKGETDEEIAGCADGMRSKALMLDTDYETLDIVAEIDQTALIFQLRPPLQSQRQVLKLQSTVTVPHHQKAVLPIAWKHLVLISVRSLRL